MSLFHPKAEKFLVFDVEGYSTAKPYNIGYIVADRYGKIYRKRSFALLSCIWENIESMISSRSAEQMTKANIQEILKDMEHKRTRRKYKNVSISEFYHYFKHDIQHYKIKRLFAYNVNFDKASLFRLLGEKHFTALNLEYCDIISGILTTKLTNKKYIDFCLENNFLTEKRNIMTKAEIVYKYLTNSLDFVEEHTGLADCLIEYQILLAAFNSHKKLDWKPCQAWRVLKKFCEENEIDLN